jgi:hypothetical protein
MAAARSTPSVHRLARRLLLACGVPVQRVWLDGLTPLALWVGRRARSARCPDFD